MRAPLTTVGSVNSMAQQFRPLWRKQPMVSTVVLREQLWRLGAPMLAFMEQGR